MEETTMAELKLQLPPEVSVEEARLMLMVKLFEAGRLSLGQAAKFAGYSKSTFIELLGKMGVAVFDYPAEELQKELEF
jgi:predicted HTH domain antitoxin